MRVICYVQTGPPGIDPKFVYLIREHMHLNYVVLAKQLSCKEADLLEKVNVKS